MPGPHHRAEPTSGPSDRDGVTDLVRWAAFSCFLVPVALLWYGASFAGAAGTALGLAAVTGACRLLLRRSERVAARPRARRGGRQAHRGGRHTGENTPVD
ncbi:hypothetical protein ACIQVF_31220 [Streptomyces tendae]|uniref:hypothetical protein n=1 Tax=Streptomyces tendae TaxID=1932 RepID=UPI0038095DDC